MNKLIEKREQDKGFTLVELLIVIVILGILATVTVFAVRGITDKAEENTCQNDRAALITAAEAYYTLNGSYGSLAEMVTAEVLKEAPTGAIATTYSVTGGGTGYSIGTCTAS